MNLNKYDPLKPANNSSQTRTVDAERGFTAADYDDHSNAPGAATREPNHNQPWMSSTEVILLIEYLRKHPDKGIILYERYGKVGLKFNPGLNGADMKNGRVQVALNALILLQDAKEDLLRMIKSHIEVPLLIRYSIEPQNKFTGPSANLPAHGNSNPDFSLLVKN